MERDPEFFLNGIRQLGRLFDFDAFDPYDYAGFGQILEELDQNFNISAKLKDVSVFLESALSRFEINEFNRKCSKLP